MTKFYEIEINGIKYMSKASAIHTAINYAISEYLYCCEINQNAERHILYETNKGTKLNANLKIAKSNLNEKLSIENGYCCFERKSKKVLIPSGDPI